LLIIIVFYIARHLSILLYWK